VRRLEDVDTASVYQITSDIIELIEKEGYGFVFADIIMTNSNVV